MGKCSAVKFPVNMSGLVLDNFSVSLGNENSLENDIDEHLHKHKKIDYEKEEELLEHVVYAPVDEIPRIVEGAYQRRKNRNRDYEKYG